MTISALRKIQDEADPQPESAAGRRSGGWPTATPKTVPAVEAPKPLPVERLLKWGEEHDDPEVQDQASRAGLLLAALRKRHAADKELAEITTEAEELRARLAELEAREAELVPAKPKTRARKGVDYPAAEVRAWAAEHGHTVPPVGRVPKTVVAAWREATGR